MINGIILILILLISRSDGNVPQRPSYSAYISQVIHFARGFAHVRDFNNRSEFLTAKRLKQGYWSHKLRKAFSKRLIDRTLLCQYYEETFATSYF